MQTSCITWSTARCRNVEYTATTGRIPPAASPAAKATRCPSDMPTSKKRPGNSAANGESPVPSRIPAVRATMRESRRASSDSAFPKTSLHPSFFGAVGRADAPPETPWYAVGSSSAG